MTDRPLSRRRLLAEFECGHGRFRVGRVGSALAGFSSSDDTQQDRAYATLGPRISWSTHPSSRG